MKKALSILLAALILLPATCLPVFADDAPAFSTYDEMVAYVRQALTARDANIRFRFDGNGFQPPAISDLCADSADGKAGDYLRLSFDGGFPQTTKDADGVYTVAARFFTDAAQEAQVDAFVRGAADACEAQTPREKARYIYDLLCSEVAFDLENLYDEAVTDKYTAWGAAVEGKAVCQGFAQLYYRLAKALELPCRIVTGTRAGENHAWNIVEVDGYWYHVDAASGAQLVDPYPYFIAPGLNGYSIVYGDHTDSAIMNYAFAPEDAENRFATGAASYLISWSLDKTTGAVTVEGEGQMTKDLEWPLSNNLQVRSVVIGEGVTTVSAYAFAGCRNLETVSFPQSLTAIGDHAFSNCKSLRRIEIPAGVTELDYSFAGCTSIERIDVAPENPVYHSAGNCLIETQTGTLLFGCGNSVIPDDGSVTEIGPLSFEDTVTLTGVSIPDSVTVIGDDAFYGCSGLANVSFGSGLREIRLEAFMNCALLREAILPDGMTRVGDSAFRGCESLSRVRCGDGTVEIGSYAFRDCPALADVTIPDSVYEIGHDAFDGTAWLADQPDGVVLAGRVAYAYQGDMPAGAELVLPENTTGVAYGAFASQEGLTRVTIPENVTLIGAGAFFRCPDLVSVSIGTGAAIIHGEAFLGCSNLIDLTIPDSVYYIGPSALDETAWLNAQPDGVVYAGRVAYAYQGEMPAETVLSLQNGTTGISPNAFENQRGLTGVTIPDSVIEIGYSAFQGCSALASVKLPAGLRVIADSTFESCRALTAVEIPDSVTEIGISAFEFSGLTELAIPDGVTIVRANAAFYCPSLSRLTIGKNAQITRGAFSECTALETIDVDSRNPYYSGAGNCLIERDTATLLLFCENSVIPWDGSVTRLDKLAFLNCQMTTFTIPDSVTEIPDDLLYSAETICGMTGSYAETYARKHSLAFIPACPVAHAPHSSVTVDAFDATCLEPAYTAGTRCADCGEWLSGHEPVGEPLGHTGAAPVRENVTDPTCTAEGAYDAVIYCARCGEKLSSTRERIAAVPHADRDENGFCDDCGADICEHSRTRERVGEAPATCTANGYSGDTVCLICGRTLLYGATIPAAGHAPVMTVTAVSPTCISAGRTAGYACSVCGEITTASRVLPVSGHTDDDADGWCDVCFSPEDCTRYGVCGDAMYWFVANETLTLSGAGDSYTFSGNAPWDAYRDDFDCVYLRAGVRTVDGTAFGAANRVFAPVGASVTDCPVPALVYTDDHGTVSLTQTDGVCAMQVYDVLNAAYVLCMDREVRALRFDEIALESTEDDFTYDILMNGKLVDERHFTVPAGTVVRDFTVKTAGYASFNDAMTALGSHPDRNLILSVRCDDLLLASMKTDPDSYTVQIVVRFVDEPEEPVPDEEPEQKGFLGSFIDRFKATLAAILALFRKLFKLFTGK